MGPPGAPSTESSAGAALRATQGSASHKATERCDLQKHAAKALEEATDATLGARISQSHGAHPNLAMAGNGGRRTTRRRCNSGAGDERFWKYNYPAASAAAEAHVFDYIRCRSHRQVHG